MNNILDFIPDNSRYLNNFQQSCKLFKSTVQSRLDDIFWTTLEEFLGKKNCEGLKNNTLKKLIIPRYNVWDKRRWARCSPIECSPMHLECLYSILKQNTYIEEIEFSQGTGFKYSEDKKVAQILKTNTTWRSIQYSRMYVSVKPFCVALKHNTTLKELSFYGNDWGSMNIYAISQMLKVNSSLESLCLSESGVDNNGLKLLASALKENSSLKYLGLCTSDEFGIESIIELAKALKINKSLTSLSLGCNENGFGDDADKIANAMAKMLQYNSTLEYLDLSLGRITGVGVTKLAVGLKNNKSLKDLQLRYCKAGDDGARAIGWLLKHNTTLKSLDLYDNYIGNKGAMYLYHGMVENNTLESITFSPENEDAPEIEWETWNLLRELAEQKENLIIHHGLERYPI